MGSFVAVAKVGEIAVNTGKCVEVEGKKIALFNLDGQFYAIDELCTHADGPLSEGTLEGDEVECPWHCARFNIKTGEATEAPAFDPVETYPARINGDAIEVEL